MDKSMVLLLIAGLITEGICGVSADELTNISRVEFEDLKATVSRLEHFANKQTVLNKRLESDLDKQRAVILELQNIIAHQEKQIQQDEKLPEKKREENQNKPSTTEKRSALCSSKMKRHPENTVAFFATLTQSYLDHLGSHQNLVFEDVVTNIGNAYNNHQGVFVAPVSGLYLITTSVLSRQDREFFADVVVNGTVIVRLNGRGTDGRHGSGAQTTIIALKKGDDVSVQNIATDDDYWGQKYSSFGGFLIQEFEIDSSIIIG